MVGTFSEAFDLISSEYGWHDEDIEDLRFSRFTQILAAIRTRRFMRKRDEDLSTSWAIRTVVSYIVGGYMAKAKDKEEIFTKVAALSLDSTEKEYLRVISGEKALEEWRPGMPAPIPESKLPTMAQLTGLLGGGRSGHAGAGHGG